jgi:quercetin dioxygenase-like cupin family protein
MTQLSRTLMPGEGETVHIGTTTQTTFKAVGADTDNRLGLFEHRMAPGAPGASPHIHKAQLECFYVLEGTVELYLDGKTIRATPGTYVQVPESVGHGFRNPFDEDARMLIMFSPGFTREEYFRRLAALYADGRSATEDELVQLMAEFDQFEVGYTGDVPGWGRHT